MTTGDAVSMFLKGYFKTNDRSPKTIRAYAFDLEQLRDFIGTEEPLESVGPQNVEGWAESLQSRPYLPASVRRKLAAAWVFFSYWVRRGALSTSPMWKLRFSLGRTRVLPRSLSPSTSELLIGAAWKRYKQTCTPRGMRLMEHLLAARDLAIVETFFATGMRVCEIVKLDVPDWQPNDSYAFVRGKGGRERLCFFPDDRSVAALRQYLIVRHRFAPKCNAIFVSTTGKRLLEQAVAESLARVAKESEIDQHITPHMIRHTVATLLLRYGADLRIVQEVLGHASIVTTQRYVHVAKDHLLTTLRARHPNFHLRIPVESYA